MRFEIMGARFAGGGRGDNRTLLRIEEVALVLTRAQALSGNGFSLTPLLHFASWV